MIKPPLHLNRQYLQKNSNPDSDFIDEVLDDEILVRRFQGSNDEYEKELFFLSIPKEYVDHGVSCNRVKYCKNDTDVLWSHNPSPPAVSVEECDYTLKNGKVIYIKVSDILSQYTIENFNEKCSRSIAVQASPNDCNISHADIRITPRFSDLSKKERNMARLLLAQLFRKSHGPTYA